MALTSKPPSENELAEVSYVCSQTSCHPTGSASGEDVSRFLISELVSDFDFSRPERPVFDVLPLCEPLAPWFALLVPLAFPSDVPLF